MFEVIWQSSFHMEVMSEKFNTEQEAIDSVNELEHNAKKMGDKWIVAPFSRKI